MAVKLVTVLLIALWASVADAEQRRSIAVLGAGELHVAPETSGNGFFLVEAEVGQLRLSFNTETLDVSWGAIALDETTELRVGLAGEAFLAGVSSNYYVRGELDPGRGFLASWAGPYAELTRRLGSHGFLGWRSAARRWWFGGETDRGFTLPPDFTSLEQKVSLTYWDFRPDPSLYEPHRLFRRLLGVGAGVQGEFWWRSAAADWGEMSNDRNLAQRRNFSSSQWAAVGAPLGAARVQFEERLYIGVGEDDLNRAMVGGLNPYTIRVAGLGWPAYRTSKALSGHASLHAPITGESELGFAVDGALLNDPFRDGTNEVGAVGGASAFLDLRFGPWQVDLRVGWALDVPHIARAPQLGAFVAVGRSL